MRKFSKREQAAPVAIGAVAIYCGLILVILTVLGPLVLNSIPYRTSPRMLQHIAAQDIANTVLAAPLCFISGILFFMRKPAAGKWLVLPGLYLVYTGLVYGMGNEWSSSLYNISRSSIIKYIWLFISLIAGGLYLSLAALILFPPGAVPVFKRKQKKLFILLTTICLLFFSSLWVADIFRVAARGAALITTSYAETPTAFWAIKFMDLGIILPASFFALYLFAVKPRAAYPLLLLLFGFFMLMLTAAVIRQVVTHSFFHDYTLILVLLCLLSYTGYFFLARPVQRNAQGQSPGSVNHQADSLKQEKL